MGRYLTPLPGLVAQAIEFVVNRAAALDEQADEALKPLENRWLKFEFQGPEIELWLSAVDGRMQVLAEARDDRTAADTTISGTPGALLAMALPDLDGPGGVRIEGDARLAQKFQQAIKSINPDIERGLSAYFGELIGPQIYRIVIEATELGRRSSRVGGDQLLHWLKNESRLLPASMEWKDFSDG
ncbi:MAG: SCP2 sterol-binding domain-containing protein, partial [Xanthomonadaceae bacterium]|nr:SCP2 sterol-binding domain-containing protein [Xanthomonadaceae bacterium]